MRKLILATLCVGLAAQGLFISAAVAQGDAEIAAGQEAMQAEDYATAVAQFQAAAAAAPDFAAAHFFLGEALYRQSLVTTELPTQQALLAQAVAPLQRAIELAPETPQARFYLGRIYLQQGIYDLALEAFEAEMEISRPQRREELYHGMGLALAGLEQYVAAIRAFESAVELDDHYSEAQYDLAKVLYDTGDYEGCAKWIDRLTDAMQDYRLYRHQLNLQTQDQKRTPELTEEWVAQEYRHCIDFARRQPDAFKLQGRAYHATRDYSRSRTAYRLSLREMYDGSPSDPDALTLIIGEGVSDARDRIVRENMVTTPWTMLSQAEEQIQELLDTDPNYAPAHNVQGEVFYLEAETYLPDEDRGINPKTFEEAVECFQKAIDIYAGSEGDLLALAPLRSPANFAVAETNMGRACIEVGDIEQAVTHLEHARELDPESRDALGLLSSAYAQMGDADMALALIDAAMEENAEDPVLHNVRGEVLMYLDRPTEAARAFRTALDIEPRYATAVINLGHAYFESESWTNARFTYEKALDQVPMSPLIKLSGERSRLWHNIGLALANDLAFESAVEAYNEALALNPSFLAAQIDLGISYSAIRNYDAAERAFRTALQLAEVGEDVEQGQIHAKLSAMYLNMGRAHDAYYEATQALALVPDNPEALALRDSIRAELTGGAAAVAPPAEPEPDAAVEPAPTDDAVDLPAADQG